MGKKQSNPPPPLITHHARPPAPSFNLAPKPLENLMTQLEVGKTALITTDNWFYAPDGRSYRAVFGTIKAVKTSEETLGVRTNARSTNWYVEIGCLTLAGCQIHYAVRCDSVSIEPATDWTTHEGVCKEYTRPSTIFLADNISP
jgi:hypothetical protein